jgi:hypothetical protein
MAKRIKKIKVKKPRQPRQPRKAGVPRKPPVTNISVNISGGSNQPSGSYYFPDAQQVQPLVNNLFTQAPMQTFRPRIEEPVRDVVEMATQTAAPKKKLVVVADVGLQTQEEPISAGRRGRPLASEIRPYNPNNKTLAQVQEAALGLGIQVVNEAGKNLTKKQLAKMINQERV